MLLSMNLTSPGAGEAQQRLDATSLHLLGVQLVGFDDGVDVFELAGFVQVLVDVGKQAGVDVGLLGEEQVGGERQLAFAGDLPATSLYRRKRRS
jgi:hypothetical protein